jgi:hypothetical protein
MLAQIGPDGCRLSPVGTIRAHGDLCQWKAVKWNYPSIGKQASAYILDCDY